MSAEGSAADAAAAAGAPRVDVQPTPNPNALKFVLDRPVKTEGSSTYRDSLDCGENRLAAALFSVRGVSQLHFFGNAITVTKFGFEEWDDLEDGIIGIVGDLAGDHDPDYFDPDPEAERRAALSPELRKIEEILDRTVRPGLQGDGGDIQALELQGDVLVVRYQGACGTCPSATTGTLEAIKSILRDEFRPGIEVHIAPEL